MAKQIAASQVLIISAIYVISKLLIQILEVAISDMLGRKHSNTVPIIICLIFTIISALVALKFKNVYAIKKEDIEF